MAFPSSQPSQSDEDAPDAAADEQDLLQARATEAHNLLELDERMRLLLSLVPPGGDSKCGRGSIDLARDVSQYIERIEKEINDLRTEVQTYAVGNTSSGNDADCECQNRHGSADIQVKATEDEGGMKIYARCRKQPGAMEAVVAAVEALDLSLVNASVKCCSCNHVIFDAFGLQDGVVVQPEEVERCIVEALSHNFTEG